ncbi:MAG: GNAT family N-acetyltransferase [bacterium]
MEKHKKDVEQLVRKLQNTWLENRVVDLAPFFDENVVLFSPGRTERIVGNEAVIESYKQFLSASTVKNFQITNLHIDIFNTTAIAVLTWDISYELQDKTYDEKGHDIMILNESKSNWKMNIRKEQNTDIKEVWQINSEAFETDAEANLVDSLRNAGIPYISLVAEEEGKIVGHIMFTPVELTGHEESLKIIGLAPVAVAKRVQNKGIGSELVKAGLEQCNKQGYEAVVVLGHPEYYPRFGFIPSVRYGIKSEYEVPDEAFMVLELQKGALKNKTGTIKYHAAFSNV